MASSSFLICPPCLHQARRAHLCTHAVPRLCNISAHIWEHKHRPGGRTGLGKGCTCLLGGTEGRADHTLKRHRQRAQPDSSWETSRETRWKQCSTKTHSGTCLIPGRKLEGILPHKLLRGESGLPCTAGSQSSGNLCRCYSSSHTLEENKNQFRAALSGVLTLHMGLALGVYKLWENITYFHLCWGALEIFQVTCLLNHSKLLFLQPASDAGFSKTERDTGKYGRPDKPPKRDLAWQAHSLSADP